MSTNLNDIILPAIGFLASLSEEDRKQLKVLGEVKEVKVDQVVIEEGANQDHLYILLSGKVKVLQKRVAPAVTAWVEPGESFGEVNLFDLEEAGASASVVAAEASTLWQVDRDGLNAFIAANPSASLNLVIGLATLLSSRLRAMNELVQEMSVWTRS